MGIIEATVKRFLYYPLVLDRHAEPPGYVRGAEEVRIESSDGNTIHGLSWPAPDKRPTILFFHGNAQSVFEWALVREDLAALDCGLLLIDYPGYGKSTGTPNERGLYAAGRASLEFLTGEVGVPAERVVLFGKSLGGGVATKVAAEHEIMGVILESTFRSIPAVIHRLLPFVPAGTLLKSERFESISRIGQIRAPILVVHGTHDELIPYAEGRALFDAAPEPKELYRVAGAHHNDVSMVAGEVYGETLRRWLDGITTAA